MQVKTYALARSICVTFAGSALAKSGIASVYGKGDGYAWKKTASGERINPGAMTAAHRTLPSGSRVKITNRNNGRSVSCAFQIADLLSAAE